jgi:hypothetical protein
LLTTFVEKTIVPKLERGGLAFQAQLLQELVDVWEVHQDLA